MSTEVIVTDPLTGGQKGAKSARFSLIPFDWLWAMAEHYGVGATKYADRNWERGYKWSLSLDAHSRHLNQWLMGEDNDLETGSSHLIAAAWHLIALWVFHKRGLGTDDLRTTVPITIQLPTLGPNDVGPIYTKPKDWSPNTCG